MSETLTKTPAAAWSYAKTPFNEEWRIKIGAVEAVITRFSGEEIWDLSLYVSVPEGSTEAFQLGDWWRRLSSDTAESQQIAEGFARRINGWLESEAQQGAAHPTWEAAEAAGRAGS